MNKLITVLSIGLLCLLPQFLKSQTMTAGFEMLESGKNAEATVFFKDILRDHPENKTALICYGRAVGLSGNPAEAKLIFSKLDKTYPNDKEVLLNLAESLLWNSNFEDAISQYNVINNAYPNDAGVLRSLANAYAANQDYENAYQIILQSLAINQTNESSQHSHVSIGLAYAHQLKVEKKYSESLAVLESLSNNKPLNKNVIVSKAYTYLAMKDYDAAKHEFTQLKTASLDTIQSYLGLASVDLQKQNYKSSLASLKHGYFDDKQLSTQDSTQRFDLIFGNYLNLKPKQADKILNTSLKPLLSPSQHAEKQIYVNLATESYENIPTLIDKIDNRKLQQDITLRYVLEADKYKQFSDVLSNIDDSLLDDYSHTLLAKIENELAYQANSTMSYAEDNAQNTSKELTVDVSAPKALTFSPFLHLRSRWVQSPLAIQTANHSVLRLGSTIKTKHNQLASISLGVESNNISGENQQYQSSYHLSYFVEINNRHFIKLITSRSQLDYNQDLLSENIWKNNIGLEHHIVSRSGIGSYSQLNRSYLNDGNSGIDAFNSLYVNLSQNPVIQTGLNSTLLTYKDATTAYYSPEYVFSISPFIKASNEYQTSQRWKYQLTLSAGQQYEAQADQAKLIYNIQLRTGYILSQHLFGEIFYTYANNNSSLNNGFSTYITGLKIRYSL